MQVDYSSAQHDPHMLLHHGRFFQVTKRDVIAYSALQVLLFQFQKLGSRECSAFPSRERKLATVPARVVWLVARRSHGDGKTRFYFLLLTFYPELISSWLNCPVLASPHHPPHAEDVRGLCSPPGTKKHCLFRECLDLEYVILDVQLCSRRQCVSSYSLFPGKRQSVEL